jgi:hypothetical protein
VTHDDAKRIAEEFISELASRHPTAYSGMDIEAAQLGRAYLSVIAENERLRGQVAAARSIAVSISYAAPEMAGLHHQRLTEVLAEEKA